MKNLLNIIEQVAEELNPENLYYTVGDEGFDLVVEKYVISSINDKLVNFKTKANKFQLAKNLYRLHKRYFNLKAANAFMKGYK